MNSESIFNCNNSLRISLLVGFAFSTFCPTWASTFTTSWQANFDNFLFSDNKNSIIMDIIVGINNAAFGD